MHSTKTNIETKLTEFLTNRDESGLEIFRLLQLCLNDQSNSIVNEIEHNSSKYSAENKLKPIGTWYPEDHQGEIIFSRQKQNDSIFWESSRDLIKQKKDSSIQKRVCVIGESAAAGMFFTPHFSPSIALRRHLDAYTSFQWDVIDLTRNSINSAGIIATFEAALQLELDFIVICAGNNWFSDIHFEHNPPLFKRRAYANILKTQGPVALASAYQGNLERHTRYLLQKIDTIAKNSLVKLILVIPASNYAHWERRCPTPWLGDNNTAKWYEMYRIASKALENECYEEALQVGFKMLAMDGGVLATSNRIVANCLIALNRPEEAYRYCVAEVDYSNAYDQITSIPGTPSFVRKIFNDFKFQTDITIIDLESIFIDYLGKKILDNSLFIDFCHMTPEGFNVAMAPIASLIIHQEVKKDAEEVVSLTWQELTKKTHKKSKDIELFPLSVAYFYIALYNLHLNQPVINKHDMEKACNFFRKAIQFSKDILDIMEDYVRARCCEYGAGFSLSKSGQRLIQRANSPLDIPVARFAEGVDAFTIEALCLTLEEYGRNGVALMSEYQQHYLRLLDRGVDLTEPLYVERITSVVRLTMDSEINTRRRLPYFKSSWPCTYFSLVADKKNDLEIQITCRIANIVNSHHKEISILINENLVAKVKATAKWSKHKIFISKNMLNNGFNRLLLEWPELDQDETQKISEVATRYSKGLKVDIFPVFGEVFSLIVRRIKI